MAKRTARSATAGKITPLFEGAEWSPLGGRDDERDQSYLRKVRPQSDNQRALMRATGVELFPTLAVGRRCRVRSGPLRDVEGVVLRWNDAWRLCIGVTLIGQSAMVEIDAALLEPLD